MYFVGGARDYGIYGIIQDLWKENNANFVNDSGRYRVNWVRALDLYADYKRKKDPHFNLTDHSRRALSNSLKTALLSKSYKRDGADEYTDSKKYNSNGIVVERQFQMPHKVFKSFFGNAEPSDSSTSEEQDEQERKRHLSKVS